MYLEHDERVSHDVHLRACGVFSVHKMYIGESKMGTGSSTMCFISHNSCIRIQNISRLSAHHCESCLRYHITSRNSPKLLKECITLSIERIPYLQIIIEMQKMQWKRKSPILTKHYSKLLSHISIIPRIEKYVNQAE